jgi:hypothetical protein
MSKNKTRTTIDKNIGLPVVLVASIAAGEALLSVHHSDTLASQPHTDVEITEPFATTVSSISVSGGENVAATALDWDEQAMVPIRPQYSDYLNMRAVAQILAQDEAVGAPHELNPSEPEVLSKSAR